MKCGRELDGAKVVELGVCPAAIDSSFDGINSGKNAGRICWAVAGTFCGGKIQGTFAEKRDSCINCPFFKIVQTEQGREDTPLKFLKYLSDDKRALLGKLSYKYVRAGERFITQGEIRGCAYIINRGSGLVIVEKDGELHPVGHRGKGDIVGVVQILTGEPQHAHVDAETDMQLWVLEREQFLNISQKDPDFLDFITEIVADRFDSKRPTADRVIGKYIATDIIGRGGYSITYKGIHKALDLPVAIKMMRHNLAMDSGFLNSFYTEAKIIAKMNHENIVKVYDIEERFKTVFIIMELVEGESLTEMIDRLKAIPQALAANFLVQICSGLHFAHQQGILHQDINPSNIFVQRNDQVKILDFGLACPVDADDRSIFDGTIYYMSPEQIRCEPVDQRSDIYSLGITAYEMVTGRKPFEANHLKTLMDMHCHQDIPDPVEIVPELPETFRRFIIKACRKDANQRYQNFRDAQRALLPLVQASYLIPRNQPSSEKRQMCNMLMTYPSERYNDVSRLIEDFSLRAQEFGVVLNVVNPKEI